MKHHKVLHWDGRKDIEFVPDEWLRVVTDNKDSARKFFGAPANWPVRFAGFCRDRRGRIFEVLAVGLEVR